MEATFKILFTLGGFYTPLEPVQPNHFQADQIWCDGTFKLKIDFITTGHGQWINKQYW